MGLLPSDTRVEVLETEGKWAKVTAENGRTGWVMQRYLVKDVPKSV
ncbi:SH3 domain-containing protein, partial [Candidatus Bathyarchaeota archaeon]|nr:SH3 domain-containing protein [Candidatus Bathyarchaeota archaeon]NIW09208.1 SH3 domain-containing protein [Gammaproteobacteria bacterium]